MSNSVRDLVSAIATGNAVQTEQAFNATMAEKISAKLDNMRMDVAQSLFNQTEEEELVYEEVQLTQEEYDALTEEEKQAFVLDEGLGKFVGKVVKGTAKLAGKAVGAAIGGVARTAGAIRQVVPAVKDAYAKGRIATHKAIAG